MCNGRDCDGNNTCCSVQIRVCKSRLDDEYESELVCTCVHTRPFECACEVRFELPGHIYACTVGVPICLHIRLYLNTTVYFNVGVYMCIYLHIYARGYSRIKLNIHVLLLHVLRNTCIYLYIRL